MDVRASTPPTAPEPAAGGVTLVRPRDGAARGLLPRPPVEVGCSWRERIVAPLDMVWAELTFDAVLAPLANVRADVALGDRRAWVELRLSWGPLTCTVAGPAAFGRIQPTGHAFLLLSLPALDLDYRCAFDLTAAGADVTNLRSEGQLRCGHRYIRRCPGLLATLMEDHLRAVSTTTSQRAQRRYQAQIRLGGLDNRFHMRRTFCEAQA
jgi:hypothetical protein